MGERRAMPAPTAFSPNVELLNFVNDNRPWTLEAFALAFVPPDLLQISYFTLAGKQIMLPAAVAARSGNFPALFSPRRMCVSYLVWAWVCFGGCH
jgi:hypothetical protein